MRGAPEARFWAKVEVRDPDDCWPWQGTIDRRGYGKFRHGPTTLAHRAAYLLFLGAIDPPELTVDHLCFRTDCVNPAHLRLLTRSQNSSLNQNSRKTHCPHGHEYTPENTYRRPDNGSRACRRCHSIRTSGAARRLAALAAVEASS